MRQENYYRTARYIISDDWAENKSNKERIGSSTRSISSSPRKSRSKSRDGINDNSGRYQDTEPFEQTLRTSFKNMTLNNPAKFVLLSKLKQVDLEIDQLARDLVLNY